MSAANGFHLTVDQLEAAITPNAKALLLNSPHNPTGSVLSREEIDAIGQFCERHNLWIVCDEVYEQLIYRGTFASALDVDRLADRTIVVSSISKSHAAPGFRSGWCIGPDWFTDKMQGLSEAILFGGQPFIADMTRHALSHPDDTAERMCQTYQHRIDVLMATLDQRVMKPLPPEAGMFMLIDISASGLNGSQYALKLLNETGVATMPGDAFGKQADNFIRLSLTVDDDKLHEAARRMNEFAGKFR